MAKTDAIRWAIGTPCGLRSSPWLIMGNKKGDIYIAPRALGGITKMSLHRDGKCQVGFTNEYPRDNNQGSRHWETWKLPAIPPPVRVLRILVPQSELREFTERHDDRLNWLAAPEVGAIGVVALVLAPANANFVVPVGAELLGTIRTDIRSAWAFYTRHAIDQALAATIADARARMHQRFNLPPVPGTRSIWWSEGGHDRAVLELAYEAA